MFSKKQLLLNVMIVALALAAGAGTLWAVYAEAETCTNPTTYYHDADGDTYGDPGDSVVSCSQPARYVTNNTDCNDALAAVNPGTAEVCDGIDNNCSGINNEGLATSTYYRDIDGDNYGTSTETAIWCAKPEGYATVNNDCNDNAAGINPGETEICNSIDDDCDGTVDESCVNAIWYRDADSDGYGDSSVSTTSTAQPSGYVSNHTDCNDVKSSVHPSATETCNGIDDDCDGNIDEGVKTTWYRDVDGDSYGNNALTAQSCSAPSGYVAAKNDCNDSVAAVHPNATETCNGIDDDCDSTYDEGCSTINTYYRDADGDGYGNASISQQAASQPAGFVANDDDCNDANSSIRPNAIETDNDIDDDCDGSIDENITSTYYRDADGDGYGNASISQQAASQPAGFVANDDDCNDAVAAIHPGAIETDNNIDDDCDGTIDEGFDNSTCGNGCNCQCSCKCSCDCSKPEINPVHYKNHGAWVSAWAHYTNCLKWKGEISGKDKGEIMKEKAKQGCQQKHSKKPSKGDDCDD